jgi:hypothetical protein
MPRYDFLCQNGHAFDDVSFYNDASARVEPVGCWCGSLAERIWLTPPSVRSDEVLPADMRGALGGRTFETRREHDAYVESRGLVAVTPKEFEERVLAPSKGDGEAPRSVAAEESYAAYRKDQVAKIESMMWKQKEGLLPPAGNPDGTSKRLERVGAMKAISEGVKE